MVHRRTDAPLAAVVVKRSPVFGLYLYYSHTTCPESTGRALGASGVGTLCAKDGQTAQVLPSSNGPVFSSY